MSRRRRRRNFFPTRKARLAAELLGAPSEMDYTIYIDGIAHQINAFVKPFQKLSVTAVEAATAINKSLTADWLAKVVARINEENDKAITLAATRSGIQDSLIIELDLVVS